MICAFHFPYYNMIRFWIMRYVMHQIEIHRPAGRKWCFLIRLISLSLAHTTIIATSVPNTILERTGQGPPRGPQYREQGMLCLSWSFLLYKLVLTSRSYSWDQQTLKLTSLCLCDYQVSFTYSTGLQSWSESTHSLTCLNGCPALD